MNKNFDDGVIIHSTLESGKAGISSLKYWILLIKERKKIQLSLRSARLTRLLYYEQV